MTTPLSDLSRNLLAAARDGMTPDAAAAERVRARVAAAVGAPAVGAAIVATPAKATAAVALPVKVGLIAVVVIGAVAATVLLVRGGDDTRAPQLSTRGAEVDEVRSHHAVAAPEPEAPAAAATTPARPTQAPASATTLAREVELIDRAMQALAVNGAGPAAAIEAIAIYDRETRGRGQMAEDAAAIAIEAHCTLGDDVRTKLEAFDHAYPSSAQRARITDTCRK